MVLPGLGFLGWYAFGAFAAHERYNRAGEGKQPLSMELFQLHLHDRLRSDIRRLGLPALPAKSKVPAYNIVVDPGELPRLYDDFVFHGRRPYIRGVIETDRTSLDVELRYRGTKHWHWNYPQKSFKVRLLSVGLLEEARAFNFINEVTPLGMGEQVIMDLAAEEGLLTPEYHPARLAINGKAMGLYYFLAQPDEALLRRAGRIPGAIFSGNEAPAHAETGVSLLFDDVRHWKKVAKSKGGSGKDMTHLTRLLSRIRDTDAAEFRDFTRWEIDKEKFALFEALDIVFGGDQHDFDQNHKIYFDPYRGRFEPIAWNFRGWKHRRRFLLETSPLGIRLGLLPAYVATRNRIVYELLVGKCSINALRKRMGQILRRLAPELVSDPFWDAYKLLPGSSPYLRRMVRPMDEERQALAMESALETYSRRSAYLLKRLRRTRFTLRLGPSVSDVVPALVEVDDRAGYGMLALRVDYPKEGPASPCSVYMDGNLNGKLDSTDEKIAVCAPGSWTRTKPLNLYPLATVAERGRRSKKSGLLRVRSRPGQYLFFITGPGRPSSVSLKARSLITGSIVTSSPGEDLAETPCIEKGGGRGLAVQSTSLHPWALRAPAARTEVFRGQVEVTETKVFPAHVSVEVDPGTKFFMSPGASLIFLGPVRMKGLPSAPVVIRPRPPGIGTHKPWGGVALLGRGTAGSAWENVTVLGGTRPAWRMISFPAVVNVHDTERITFAGVRFSGQMSKSDQLHLAYVKGIVVEDGHFSASGQDAVDVEFCDGTFLSCTVTGALEDGLDVMGSRLVLRDCVFRSCRDNGVSAGQKSTVELRGCLMADCAVGALTKSASSMSLSGSLFYRNQVALRVETREVLYAGAAKLSSDAVYSVENAKDIDSPPDGIVNVLGVFRKFPDDESLDHMLRNVLGFSDWTDFEKGMQDERNR
jgi:hypothetical protein